MCDEYGLSRNMMVRDKNSHCMDDIKSCLGNIKLLVDTIFRHVNATNEQQLLFNVIHILYLGCC